MRVRTPAGKSQPITDAEWFVGVIVLLAVLAIGYLVATDNVAPRYIGTVNPEMVYVDPETGCQYLGSNQHPTPRLGPDGKQVCNAGH